MFTMVKMVKWEQMQQERVRRLNDVYNGGNMRADGVGKTNKVEWCLQWLKW